jgi:23S rRNA (cytosine1962-C5)-methyltransferase
MIDKWVVSVLEKIRGQKEARRVYHGRGGLHNGPVDLALEWYPPILLALVYKEEAKAELDSIESLFENEPEIESFVIQDRWMSGRPAWEVRFGEVQGQQTAIEDGLTYRVSFLGRQNPGIFLASRVARQWVKAHSKGLRVLNLFSFTGAFGVCALEGGANEVVQVDMKRGPLMEGKENLELNGRSSSESEFWCHDILRSKGKIRKRGPWDLVILDPPTFQKGAWSLEKDLPKIIRALEDWTSSHAKVLLCIHDPFMNEADITNWMEGDGRPWKKMEKLSLPKGFEEKDPDSGLKVLSFQKVL